MVLNPLSNRKVDTLNIFPSLFRPVTNTSPHLREEIRNGSDDVHFNPVGYNAPNRLYNLPTTFCDYANVVENI